MNMSYKLDKHTYGLFKALRKHRKLAEKRAINYEQNKTAKVLIYVLSGFMIGYLIFFAVMLAMIANSSESLTAVELMMGIAPFILLIDFLFRFMAQQTPSQIIKPYLLLPIPRALCIDTFISTSLFTWGNAIWFAMLIPYAIMSVLFVEGFWPTVGFLFCFRNGSAAVGAFTVHKLGFCPEALAGSAVFALVFAFVDIPLVIKLFEDLLNGRYMIIVSRADISVIADVHILPKAFELFNDLIDIFFRADACFVCFLFDLLTVFIRTRQKHDVIALHSLISCDRVAGCGGVAVTDVRIARRVVDGGGDIVFFSVMLLHSFSSCVLEL